MGDYPSVLLTELSIINIIDNRICLVADSGNNNVNFFRSNMV